MSPGHTIDTFVGGIIIIGIITAIGIHPELSKTIKAASSAASESLNTAIVG